MTEKGKQRMDELIAATGGARQSSSEADVLFHAIRQGKIRVVSNLIENGCDVNVRDERMRTPLMQAVYVAKDDVRTHMVRMLLGQGCDVNEQDEEGRTALMLAASETSKDDVVRRIVGTGKCDPNLRDRNGDTALIHAVYGGNASVIRILVNSSHTKGLIAVDAANNDRITPLKLAFKLRQRECVRVLVEEGGARVAAIKDRDALNAILRRSPTTPVALDGGRRSVSWQGTGGRPIAWGRPLGNTEPFSELITSTAPTEAERETVGRKKAKRMRKKKTKRTAVVEHYDSDEQGQGGGIITTTTPLGPLLLSTNTGGTTTRSLVSHSREGVLSSRTPSVGLADYGYGHRDLPTSHSNYSGSTYSRSKRLTPLTAPVDTNPFAPLTPRQAPLRATPDVGTGKDPHSALRWSSSDEAEMTPVPTAREKNVNEREVRAKLRRKQRTKSRLSPLRSGYRTPRHMVEERPVPSKGSLLPAIPSAGQRFSLIGSPEAYQGLDF